MPKWKRIYEGSRKIQRYELHDKYLGTIRIVPLGGFSTIKYYVLEFAPFGVHATLIAYFLRLREAQKWAEKFFSGGAEVTPTLLRPYYV